MTAILGISAFFHDSAAALVIDGEIVGAAQEEWFSRKKHDDSFPTRAIRSCLREAGLTPDQLDYVAFYDKPLRKFDRILETYFSYAPRGFLSFRRAMPMWLREKLHLRRIFRRDLGLRRGCPLVFMDHHESHAASAFFPSPFEEAAILTLDGVGEWSTTTRGVGSGNNISLTHHLQFPHSLGLLYSAFTYYCGFTVNSGEYKLMGLAPYGNPTYRDLIRKHLIEVKTDGSFWLNMGYFGFGHGMAMTNSKFHRLFGGSPRTPESEIDQRHMDLAASIQKVTEEIVMLIAVDLHRHTGQKNLVLAGGVALNCVANGRLQRESPFESLWIQPAAGDAGGALGAALFVWHQLLEKPRQVVPSDSQKGSFLGPCFKPETIEEFLVQEGVPYQSIPDDTSRWAYVAQQLSEGKVVGWFQGRMEFGPRALGARSILGDPRCPQMQSVLNLKIKYRESFRPFAPAVLQEHAHEWFDLEPGLESPYMLLVASVAREQLHELDDEQRDALRSHPNMLVRLNVRRSAIPAVTHVDASARIQTVDRERNANLYGLLKAFHERTGCPVLVNTSFNVRGEPIVCTPEDAFRCFVNTEMNLLVMEQFVIQKDFLGPSPQKVGEQPAAFPID